MKMDPRFRRRTLVKAIAASALIPLLGSNLIGCSDNSKSSGLPPVGPAIQAEFLHGVASGDPLGDKVIIWTRVTPESEGRVFVGWEVARDAEFSSLVSSGEGSTDAAVDYTVKVDVDGLDPAETYYYRFMVGQRTSPVGKTRTAPVGAVSAATFAVLSCSNYPAGFFNVYREVANQDCDAVLHLGDYLYEYGQGGYATGRAEEFGRVPDPTHEMLSLEDYRTRYAQYRGDPDLQAAHVAHPFILVWDDHELANDAWREGAENHDPATEGSFSARRAAAIQAWYEWLPVRPPSSEREIIYRQLPYGDLVDLLMLDTRLIARDEQNVYTDFAVGGVIDVDATRAAINDSNRHLLGREQMAWLKDRLTNSNARWQVLGQQVLMARIHLPSPIMEALEPSLAGDDFVAEGTAALFEALEAENTPPDERTAEQQALLDSAIPYNLDAWDGYNFERDELLNHSIQVGSRLVTLAGDTHNAWASQLTTSEGAPAGVEFATPSVSSPGLEAVLGTGLAAGLASLVLPLVDDLRYAEFVNRGYLTVHFTTDAVTARWRYVSNIDSTVYTVPAELSRDLVVSAATMVIA